MAKASNTFIEIYEPPNFIVVPVIEADAPVAIVLPDAVITAPVVALTAPAVDTPLDTNTAPQAEVPAQAAVIVDTPPDIIPPVIDLPASEGVTP